MKVVHSWYLLQSIWENGGLQMRPKLYFVHNFLPFISENLINEHPVLQEEKVVKCAGCDITIVERAYQILILQQ